MKFFDVLAPKGDALQIRLKRRGEAVAGIYKDDKVEVRSPSLDEDPNAEKTPRRR